VFDVVVGSGNVVFLVACIGVWVVVCDFMLELFEVGW